MGGVKREVVARHLRFVDEYCHSGNALQAYRAAYPEQAGIVSQRLRPRVAGLLANPRIIEALQERRRVITAASGVNLFGIVAAYRNMIFIDTAALAARCKTRRDVLALSEEERFSIKSIQFRGEDVVCVEFWDKLQALRHLSMLLNFAKQPTFIQTTGININVSNPAIAKEVEKMVQAVGGKKALKALTAKEEEE